MGDSTPLPNPAAIARAELFTREQFVYEGETLEEALGPGSARRRALDAALQELEDGDVDVEEEDEEPQDWQDTAGGLDADVQLDEQPVDPNADRRFWFEHATGAGKTVAALGFVEASRTGGILILTHRRNLVDQFNGELTSRGYKKRISPALLEQKGEDKANGPVTVETYQWFVRHA